VVSRGAVTGTAERLVIGNLRLLGPSAAVPEIDFGGRAVFVGAFVNAVKMAARAPESSNPRLPDEMDKRASGTQRGRLALLETEREFQLQIRAEIPIAGERGHHGLDTAVNIANAYVQYSLSATG